MLTQRLGGMVQKKNEYIDSIVKIVSENKGSCDEVWFTTDYGFPPIEVHKKSAQEIKKQAKKFRDNGIRVSLQVANTIGHGEYMKSRDCSGLNFEGSKAEHLVGFDGVVAGYCYCWRGQNFRKYIIDSVTAYVDVKPAAIWLDDDLRPRNHAPVDFGCFCDNCIKEFNEMYKTSFTREELVNEINFGDIMWRERYMNFSKQGMYDFTYELCKAINECMPDSTIGLQQAGFGCYVDGGAGFLYEAIYAATGKAPLCRPGGGAYADYNMNDFIRKGNDILRQMRETPDVVEEIRPEIENLPDVVYGKSIAGTCFETSYYFAIGSTAMSYAMMMREYEDFDWQNEAMKAFSKHRKYWEELSDINKKTKPFGVEAVYIDGGWKIKCEKPFDYAQGDRAKENVLSYINLPIVYPKENKEVLILHGEDAERITDERIEKLLSLPLITDAQTLDVLTKRGFKFGAKAEPIKTAKLRENFENHPINRGFEGKYWGGAFLKDAAWKIIDIDNTTECVGRYYSALPDIEDNGEIANAVITTEKGAKWAVFGFDLWNRTVSTNKRNQILNTVEYIYGKELPARLITPIQAIVLPRVYKDNSLACVSVVNCTPGRSGELKIKVQKPKGTKAHYMSQYNPEAVLVVEDGGIVTLPDMESWNVASVFFE